MFKNSLYSFNNVLQKFLTILRDPTNGEKLQLMTFQKRGRDIESGILFSKKGTHFYPIINGIPRLLIGYKNELFNTQFSAQIKKAFSKRGHSQISTSEQKNINTFSQHWLNLHSFNSNGFTVWGISGKQIARDVLRIFGMKPNTWKNKWVLDAGCGHGIASMALLKSGANVVGLDITEGVDQCRAFVEKKKLDPNHRLNLVQASIEHLPFAPEIFDAIYSNGVLHHTPSTKKSFVNLAKLLKKNGLYFVWFYIKPVDLYSKIVYSINTIIRGLLRPFGNQGVHTFSRYWVHLMQLYHRLRKLIGLGDPYYLKLSVKDHLLEIYDHFAIAYDWHHSYEEVYEWYDEQGFFFRPILGISTSADYKKHGVSVIGIKQA
jgi:2-polyprenyl-3-methyl-5-hydroxy-6-metoxy-1,4-benzoquinol methylase